MLKLEADEGDKELIQTIETPALLDIINVTRKWKTFLILRRETRCVTFRDKQNTAELRHQVPTALRDVGGVPLQTKLDKLNFKENLEVEMEESATLYNEILCRKAFR